MNPVATTEHVLNSGVDAQNPWPGLVAFTEELQKFFYGRAEEADELQRRVERKNLTVLFGQSGLGKSSLLYAALFPRLRAEGYLPIPIRLDHTSSALALADQVKAAVTRAIQESGGRAESNAATAGDTLWEHFHRRSLCQLMQDGKPVRLVLVFDQFEELFAIGQASEETRARAARFLKELADFIENRAPDTLEQRLEENPELAKDFIFGKLDYRTLVALREDYLPHLEGLRQLMPSITENRMRLTRMTGTAALEAVIKPGGNLITPEVGRQVVRFVAGSQMRHGHAAAGLADADDLSDLQVEPSLLSLVCRELNGRRLALGLPQITADLVAGNRERILQDFYERCVADQPAAVRAFVEDELVTDSGLRENMALERARRTLSQRGAPPSAIDELVKRRLLHLEERLDIQRVELTHDVLTTVVKKSRDERQQKEATLRAELQAQETREKARRQRRRARLIMAGMAIVLVGVITFGAVSFYQYHVSYERWLEAERQKHEAEIQKERAEKEEQDAKQARAEAIQGREAAEANRKLADRNFAEAMLTVDGFLTKISREELAGIPGMQKMREQSAQEALKKYQRFAENRPDDREVAAGLARAHRALAAILGQIGTVEDAVKHFTHALEIQRRLLKEAPTSAKLRLNVAKSQFDLAQFYWSINDKVKARSLVEVEIPDLEKLVEEEPANLEARFALAKAFNLLGNVNREEGVPGAKAAYERSHALLLELRDHDFRRVDVLKGLSAPLHNLALYHKNLKEDDRALELYLLSHKYNEEARTLAPDRPDVESDGALTLAHVASLLRKLGRVEEALKRFEESAARHRLVVRSNPQVSRYRWLFADDLLYYAQAMSAAKRYGESQKLYEESAQMLEELIEQAPDRAMYASKLIDTLEQLSSFHQGSTGDATGKLSASGNVAEQIRYLDRAIAIGRKLSPRFPRDVNTQYQFITVLFRRAVISEDDRTQDKASLAIYEEALETFRKGIWEVQKQPDSFEVSQMLRFLQSAVSCARRLKRQDKVLEFTDRGYQMGKKCTQLEGVNGLCGMLLTRADVLRESGKFAEAIQTCADVVKLGKPTLEKAPWHWYLRHDIREACRGLAEMHEKEGDFQNEVLAHREYLKVWAGPMHGMKIDKYIDPKNPTDEPEARRLRAFRKLEPNMFKASIPADFNGVKYPFNVYFTNVPYPKDPLEDQAKWLSEIRGGKFTEDYREAFRTLNKLAHEHNIPFGRVGHLVPNSFQQKNSVENLFDSVLKNPSSQRILLKAEADGLEAALAITPQNTEYKQTHQKIVAELKKLGPSTKLISTASAKIVLQTEARLAKTDPFDKMLKASHHQVHTLKVTAGTTYTIDAESTEFDNYLRLEDSTGKELAKDDDSGGDLNARIIHVAPKDDTVRIIVTSFQGGATGSYILTVRETRTEGLVTIAAQIAQLDGMAKKQRESANSLQAQKKLEDYRKALNKEFDIRGQQVKLNPTNALLKDAQGKVAAEIARSYLEEKEPGGAMIWVGHAGLSAPADSLLQLGDLLEKGINIKADPTTANHYRYQGYRRRAAKAFLDRQYKDALPDLKKASELPDATPSDHNDLGMCYGKLGQWKEAISAYQLAFDLEPDTVRGTGTMMNLLEAYITSDRPADADRFADSLVKKKWQPKAADATRLNQRFAFFHGLHAVARRAIDKDAKDLEKKMKEYSLVAKMDQSDWGWDEINVWWKTTKLAPDRKAAIEVILAELKGLTPLDQKTAFAGHTGILSGTGTRKVHSVPLNVGKTYQIDVTGEFDTVLHIEDSLNKDLVHNDDVNVLASNLNSRLIFSPTKDELCRLIVSSLKPGVTGKYTVKMQEVVKIGKEEPTKGELTLKDEKYKTSFAHKHKIQLEAGRPYTIEMYSDKYDTRLVLLDPTGMKTAAQNEGISANNYRLSRIDFTPHMTATYVIIATSYDPGKTGPYTLRVQGYGPAASMK